MILLQCGQKRFESLSFSPDGRHLAATDREAVVRVWTDPIRNQKPWTVGRGGKAEFLATGKLFVGNAWELGDRKMRCFLIDIGSEAEMLVAEESGLVGYLSFWAIPDGKGYLKFSLGQGHPDDTRIALYPMDSPSIPLWEVNEYGDAVRWASSFLPARGLFVSVKGSQIVLRRLSDGTLAAVIPNHGQFSDAIGSPVGPWIATRITKWIAIYTADEPMAEPVLLQNDGRKEFTGVAFHPTGRYLAATANDATVKVYDTETWKLAHVFTWDIGRMRSVAFSADGMLAAAGSDGGKILLWDWDL